MPKLAADLLKRSKNKQVVDLSVLLDEDLPITWPGGRRREAMRYLGKTLNAFSTRPRALLCRGHVLDSQVGTHLVPPAVLACRPKVSKTQAYNARASQGARRVSKAVGQTRHDRYHRRQSAARSNDGPGACVDVSVAAGHDVEGEWPASPRITDGPRQKVTKREHGPIKAGRHRASSVPASPTSISKPMPEGTAMMADPLAGKSEGWPAPDSKCHRLPVETRRRVHRRPTAHARQRSSQGRVAALLARRQSESWRSSNSSRISTAARDRRVFHLRAHQDQRQPRRLRPRNRASIKLLSGPIGIIRQTCF